MKAVLKSGESIECDGFDLMEEGVQLYDKSDGVETIAFIPHDLLHGIVPDDFEFEAQSDESDAERQSGAYTL